MAFFDTTWYVNFGDGSTTGHYAVAKRPQNTAVAAGQLVRQFTAPSVGNERVFVCIIAGTTANTTDATWTLTRGAKSTDGTATWQECTGISAVNGDLTNTPVWTAAAVNTLGVIIKRVNTASYWICSTAGTSGGTEPAWANDTAGTTRTDNTATWTCLGVVANFTGGQAPHARLANALATNWFASGNTVYVGDNHAETQGTSNTMSPSSALMARIICHNRLGSYPPAASDITTGATITGAAAALSFNGQGSFYFYGVAFITTGSAGLNVVPSAVGQTQNWYCFDSCSMQPGSNSAAAFVVGAQSTAWGVVIFNNTTVKFSGTAAAIQPYFVQLVWQNTGQILAAGSSVPTNLFTPSSSGRFSNIVLRNLDLSQLTGSLFSNTSNSSIGSLTVQDCKLNAAMTVTTPINSGMTVQLIRSDSAATAYKSTRYQYEGTETTETSTVRSGGAVDPNGQAQARSIVTSANAQWLRPFKAEPMAIYNSTVGSSVTATVCGTINAGILPNNDDIWAEFEYLGSATDPKGTIVTTTKASVLASNAAVTPDSSVWFGPSTVFDGVNTLVVLSNGNLTVTHNNTTISAGAISTALRVIGKYYFEIAVHGSLSASNFLGIMSSNFAGVFGSALMATDTTSVQLGVSGNTSVTTNGVGGAGGISLGTAVVGDIFCFAVDLTARLVWFRRNNGNWNASGTANPATGTEGLTIAPVLAFTPFVRFGTSLVSTDAMTANFGASAYTYAAPSGFGNWQEGTAPFKLATTITPQLPGYIHARVRVGKISSTYYIDPKITLT